MQKVEIYSTSSCTFCHLAKEFFKANNVAYTEFDVANDLTKRQEMIEKTGQMGVPVILINGNVVVGFDERKIRDLLGL